MDSLNTPPTCQAYCQRLRQLLVEYYQDQRRSKRISPQKAYHIQGFMEAGLITQVVTKALLHEQIDAAHHEVFGAPYSARSQPLAEQGPLLDIPTWLRKTGATSLRPSKLMTKNDHP